NASGTWPQVPAVGPTHQQPGCNRATGGAVWKRKNTVSNLTGPRLRADHELCGSWVLLPVPQRGLVLCNGAAHLLRCSVSRLRVGAPGSCCDVGLSELEAMSALGLACSLARLALLRA